MGIRSMVAAAVMAVGVGQAADAAVYNVRITLVEHSYWIPGGCSEEFEQVCPGPAGNYKGLTLNKPTFGTLDIELSNDVLSMRLYDSVGNFIDGGRYESMGNGLGFNTPGSDMSVGFQTPAISFPILYATGEEMKIWQYDDFYISGIEFVDIRIEKLPLPAGAVLLPVGLGAFAMLRKRRRTLS